MWTLITCCSCHQPLPNKILKSEMGMSKVCSQQHYSKGLNRRSPCCSAGAPLTNKRQSNVCRRSVYELTGSTNKHPSHQSLCVYVRMNRNQIKARRAPPNDFMTFGTLDTSVGAHIQSTHPDAGNLGRCWVPNVSLSILSQS